MTMGEHPFTVEALEAIVHRALRDADPQGVEAALTLMASMDPHRAADLLETTRAALAVAGNIDRADAPTPPAGRLVIICGLPGSGKTTRAVRYVAEQPLTRCRLNRDGLRGIVFGEEVARRGAAGEPAHEDAVTDVQHAGIRALLRRGFEVVVDDTNLVDEHLGALARIGYVLGVDVAFWDMTYVDVETCITQDAARAAMGGRGVGEEVIRRLHAEWLQRRVTALRSAVEQAHRDMTGRYDQMSRTGLSRWPDDDPIIVAIDHAGQVLADPFLRSRVEELAERGHRARVVIDLVDIVDGLPGADDLGGSTVLARILGDSNSRNVRYRQVFYPPNERNAR